ncbi:MAG TPA: DUF2192 domain-containing protein, partial [Candidatus Aenigmarchaeota archaeon]|nr:DUF2192 domain-containing protein [Candidatus Aenigmarchaeota archaeon]
MSLSLVKRVNIHKRRIEACVDLWGYILQHSNQLTRRKVARKLREIYHKYSVEPIRGKSKINIYD